MELLALAFFAYSISLKMEACVSLKHQWTYAGLLGVTSQKIAVLAINHNYKKIL
jgi:hypothetical protein